MGNDENHELPLHADADSYLFNKARDLRRKQTDAESRLWKYLRGRKFLNLKFRRQHPILNFIADFYCHELKMIIEVDGLYHETDHQQYYDNERSKVLEKLGYHVIRLTNKEITDIPGTLHKLEDFIEKIQK